MGRKRVRPADSYGCRWGLHHHSQRPRRRPAREIHRDRHGRAERSEGRSHLHSRRSGGDHHHHHHVSDHHHHHRVSDHHHHHRPPASAEGKTTTTAEGKTTTTAEGKTTTTAEGKTTTTAEGKTTTTAEGKTTATTAAEGKTTSTDADEDGVLVAAADDTSAGTGFEFLEKSDLGDLLTTPIGLASVLGVPLFGAFLLWWMWRRPSDDEEAPSEYDV